MIQRHNDKIDVKKIDEYSNSELYKIIIQRLNEYNQLIEQLRKNDELRYIFLTDKYEFLKDNLSFLI